MKPTKHHEKHPTIEETTSNNRDADKKDKKVYGLKAGTRKQAQQSSFLVLTIFQSSIRKLHTKALLISVQ